MVAYLGSVHTFYVDTFIIRLHVTNTMIMSWRELKQDRLRSESESVANEAPTLGLCGADARPTDELSLARGERGGQSV